MKLPTVRIPGLARALVFGAVSPLLMSVALQAQAAATPVPASEKTDEKDKDLMVLEPIEVVGSRIKRIDTQTVSPVVKIQASDLSLTGFTTIGDALRALPFNNGQAITPTDSGNSFAPGVSTINLRGLGNNSTLVLINGRRSAPYAAPGFDGFQTVFDINSIPDAAIDSVDILKDGGSAIYGSDAVGGVVNFKFRRDYEGAVAKVTVGNFFNTGGMLKKASLLAGTTNAKTSIVTTVQWQHQDPVFARDLKYTRNADKTSVAAKSNPHYRVTGWKDAGYDSEQAYLDDVGALDTIADGWFDNRSSRGFPGFLVAPVDTDEEGNTVFDRQTFSSPTSTPTLADAISGVNYYNFQETNGLFPDTESMSFFTTLRHDITDNLYVFADISFSRSLATVYAAATPVDIESEHGLDSGTDMIMPSYNPFNPWGVDINSGRRRLVELPNRINDVTSDTPRIVAGLGGKISGIRDWSWETAVLYSKNTVDDVFKGAVSDSRMQEALMGLTRNPGDQSLVWNPNTPQGERVYFNWFGTNEPAFGKFLAIENPTSASLKYVSYDISANGSVYDLPGGPLGVAIGAETRKEDFANVRTDLNATGNIVSGDEGTSSYGSRRVTAVYGEATFPFTKQIEISAAGRFEKYSDDGFAKNVRPKLGFKFTPLEWLVVRGSFSKSFKAPDLAYLFTSSQTTFSASQVHDPVMDTEIDQLQVRTVGNPELKPELTDTYYAGIAIQPKKGALKGLEVSIDWFRYEQTNLLAQLSDYYGYSEFITKAAAGDPRFAGKVVRSADTNEVLYINDNFDNLSKGLYQGYDFAASYQWQTNNWGSFTVGAQATYLDRLSIDGDDIVGSRLISRINATATGGWRYHDWELDLFGVWRGKRTGVIDYGSIFDEGDDLFVQYTIKHQITLNASVTYSGFRKYKITAGINNVLNHEPPVDLQEPVGFTPGISDPSPAFWFMSVEREF